MRVALFFWLPGLGDMSSLFLPAETTRKFDVYYEGSLLLESGRVLAATPATPGESQFGASSTCTPSASPPTTRSRPRCFSCAACEPPAAFSCFGAGSPFRCCCAASARSAQLAPFLLIAGPLFGVTVVQSLLTANLPWMNVPLVFVYGYAIASVTGGLELPFGLRRLLAARDAADGASSPAPEAARRVEPPRAR